VLPKYRSLHETTWRHIPEGLSFSYWPLLERESTLNFPGNLLLRGVKMSYNAQL
jgi:hypothetical protein